MTAPKREMSRPFPPEYVSAETLAYLLDYSRSTVDEYVKRGLLPKPEMVGTNPRWYWPDVRSFIRDRNGLATATQTEQAEEDDVFLRGVKRVSTSRA